MKRFLPFLAAVLLFLVGLALASGVTTPTKSVVVAAQDLDAGHTLTEDDVTLAKVPNPPADAFTDPAQVLGQALSVPRLAGDVITATALGGLPDLTETLKPNERLVAVKVSRSSGIAGLLQPGDRVGVTMIFDQGLYAKAAVENLRVVWVSPEFQPQAQQQEEDALLGAGGGLNTQAREGVVALAVPISAQAVIYDFTNLGLPPETRTVNAVELLSALDQGNTNVRLSLFLVPKNAQPLASSGLFLPELAVTPGPTPTPGPDEATPIPTP